MLGFPCNQFGSQEPGSDEEIREFVTSKYQVDFPMFSKIDVNGAGACELYRMLRAAQPGDADTSDIMWNFEKFVVDRSGNVVHRFSPMTSPEELEPVVSALLTSPSGT